MGLDARLRREEVPEEVGSLLWDIYKSYRPRRFSNSAVFYCLEGDEYVLYGFFVMPSEKRSLEFRVKKVQGEYVTNIRIFSSSNKAENI